MGWKTWSAITKGAIIGAIIGFLLLFYLGSQITYFGMCQPGMACPSSPQTQFTQSLLIGLIGLLVGAFIGSIVGQIIRGIKGGGFWKSMPYWLRGGSIGAVLWIIDLILIRSLEEYANFGGLALVDYILAIGFWLLIPLNLVILGIIIGVIWGKLKK